MPENDKVDISAEFLLAEFQAQQTQVVKLEETRSNRVNFFLILVGAAIAGASGIINSANLLIPANAILALVASGILVLGVATLNWCIILKRL